MQNIKLSNIENDPIKAKILLVDDEELILNSLKMTLKRYFTVFATQDPTEVSSIIAENDIDLIISDEMMPKMRGCELVERIHNKYPDITKIILSGNSNKKDIIRAVNQGHIFSFIFKPVDASQLLQTIKQGLEYKKLKEKIKLQNLSLEKKNETLIKDVLNKTSKIHEMEKFYEIGKFSASIVHNLNSPLQTLITGYQLLEDEMNKKTDVHPQLKSIMKIINDSFINMEEMIKSITTTVRNASLVKNIPVNLNEVIVNLIDKFNLNLQNSENIDFITELDGNIPNISGIKVHFEQIFSNLFKNAIDAMKDSEEKVVTIKSFHSKNSICVYIDDTGCGIPKNNINKIFKTGFTTKEFGKGSGLGLLITKQMINSYKGTITVESEVDKGTSFVIYFPNNINNS
ncbi:MAG: hybrid sensor histidine kinase/response regulator [Candidatus Delongbacteria bacterium]|jgi:two-component system sensor histidine kinase/response regulator|nr:hybrid sensor histidine kinase/response regulator [Candidatus Delongbacteria bacterium]